MGSVVYESPPVAATARMLDGTEAPGLARCRVRVMSPDENAFGAECPDAMRQIRRRRSADGSLLAAAPEPSLRAPRVLIPSEIFDDLPDAALVSFDWEFQRSDGACMLPAPGPDRFK